MNTSNEWMWRPAKNIAAKQPFSMKVLEPYWFSNNIQQSSKLKLNVDISFHAGASIDLEHIVLLVSVCLSVRPSAENLTCELNIFL